ncbi:hypothetical protein AQUCO_06200004v1 [Aquilegia coerulea]|uniref:Uncharacterized protein n=1 Tax=Aquilegia coerulea TaxID=218851 RepID=A0A2G5CCW2_AQUCA|nr:hypothetical protein AQUCO_06200004v1 [Aquilegia coerulea]
MISHLISQELLFNTFFPSSLTQDIKPEDLVYLIKLSKHLDHGSPGYKIQDIRSNLFMVIKAADFKRRTRPISQFYTSNKND